MEIMVASRDPKEAEAMVGISRVASATDKISDAAADIAAIVTEILAFTP